MKLQEIGVNLCAKQRATNDVVVHTKHGVKALSANLYDVSDESFSCGEERRLVHLHLDSLLSRRLQQTSVYSGE